MSTTIKTGWLGVLGLACWAATSACSVGERSPFSQTDRRSAVKVDRAEIAAARNAPEPDILPKTHFRAARFQESAGRLDLAMEQYRNAIAADPNYAAAYDRLGIILGYTGRHAEAVRAIRKAIDLSPNDPALRNNLGFEYILQEQWSDAERELRRAVLMDPTFHRARINLGVVLALQSKYDAALREFRKVLPEPDALYNLGLAYRSQKRFEDARKTFERILARYPGFKAARVQLDGLQPSEDDDTPPKSSGVRAPSGTTTPVALAEAHAVHPSTADIAPAPAPAPDLIPSHLTGAVVTNDDRSDASFDGVDQPPVSRDIEGATPAATPPGAHPVADPAIVEAVSATAGQTPEHATPLSRPETASADRIEAAAETDADNPSMAAASVKPTLVTPGAPAADPDPAPVIVATVADRPHPPAATLTHSRPAGPASLRAFRMQLLTASVPDTGFETRTDDGFSSVIGAAMNRLHGDPLDAATPAQRDACLPGDFDDDGDVDLADFARLQTCLARRSQPMSPACQAGDFDDDGDIDLDDYVAFQDAVFTP